MSFAPTSPVTGGAQTGLTSPTYTLSDDVAPDATGKQKAVSALGGTQTNVRLHSASDPFSETFFRPKSFRALGVPDPATGVIRQIGKNTWKLIVRKGVLPAANQPAQVMQVTVQMDIPAGADVYDTPNIRAAISLTVGLLNQQSAGLGDSLVTGIP